MSLTNGNAVHYNGIDKHGPSDLEWVYFHLPNYNCSIIEIQYTLCVAYGLTKKWFTYLRIQEMTQNLCVRFEVNNFMNMQFESEI